MRSTIPNSAVRPVMIVLFDPTSNRCSRFFQAPILCRPDFLLFQAAMEPFDVAVAFRVMIGCPPMGDAEPAQALVLSLATCQPKTEKCEFGFASWDAGTTRDQSTPCRLAIVGHIKPCPNHRRSSVTLGETDSTRREICAA